MKVPCHRQEHKGIGKAVPATDRIEQRKRGKHRQGQGQVNPCQHDKGIRPVNLGGFPKAFWHVVKKTAHDEHEKYRKRPRQNQHEGVVQEAQIPHQNVVGYDPRVEVHRKDDEYVEELPTLDVVDQGEGRKDRQSKREHRDDGGKYRRPEHRAGKGRVGENEPVIVYGKVHGNEGDLSLYKCKLPTKRPCKYIHHGKQTEQHNDYANKNNNPIADFF